MSGGGYQALRSGAGIRRRTNRGLIALDGEDRADYLQGLLTNDIVALASGEACYAAYLTPQGRLVADLEVVNLGNLILLDLHRSVTASMVARLEEFVFTEDVSATDWTDTRVTLGVDGPAALVTVDAALTRLGAAAEPCAITNLADHRCLSLAVDDAPLVVLRTDELGVPGVVVVVVPDQAEPLSAALRAAGATDVDDETAEVVRVESGRPLFPVDMDGATIPLEAGIEDRALSMTKGCYVGQEVIIRILHRGEGRVARRLMGLKIAATDGDGSSGQLLPERGAPLWHDGEQIGQITSVVASPTLGEVIGLGYVPRNLAEPGRVVEVDVGPGRRQAVVTRTPFIPAAAPTGA